MRLLFPLTALFLGTALLLSGAGLLGSLLAIRGNLAGFSDHTVGMVMACYFLGYLVGTQPAPLLIRRLGHIRSFAFCAALVAISVLLHTLVESAWAWALLRLLTGAAMVTLYTVIESWLNAGRSSSDRGQVLAAYTLISLLALALGQQLLRVAPLTTPTLFIVAALLTCLALMPVTWTRLPQPDIVTSTDYRTAQLWRDAPTAAVSSLASGVAMGAFWGMTPLFASHIGMGSGDVATFMSAAILGGALLQWPLGRWSDRSDRRRVLGLVAIAAAVSAALLALAYDVKSLRWVAIIAQGGLAFSLYPIGVAHLMDRLHEGDIIGASSRILMLYGAGAALGPLLGGAFMQWFGPGALFVLIAGAELALGAYALLRRRQRAGPEPIDHGFVPMLRTTPTAMDLHPGSETSADKPAD